jgi:predicted RNase H-like HicB family nuclease
MKLTVLIEPVEKDGYRASSGEPLGLSAEGATPEEALGRLRQMLGTRLAAGARLVQIDVPAGENPWLRGAGMFKDDPLFDEWQQAIAERRRQLDEDPDVP